MEEKSMERDFVERTIHIIQDYDGPYGVTLLVNCLLGLIVLPKEKNFNHISGRGQIHFCDLGVKESEITWGSITEDERTASRFIRCMRNSVAHIKIESLSHEGEIESLRFSDNSGFVAVFRVERLKEMLIRFAHKLSE